MTYVLYINNRTPTRMNISQSTGNIFAAEMVPAMMTQNAVFNNPDPVQIRLTPNLQTLMGPIATEGIFSCAVMVIARCLTEPEGELEQQLSVFVKDEMVFWFSQQHNRAGLQEQRLREVTESNTNLIVKKARSLGEPPQGNLPANQTVIDLISKATNPMHLAQSDVQFMPYL
jgi:transformation/transcription domain-associated protein